MTKGSDSRDIRKPQRKPWDCDRILASQAKDIGCEIDEMSTPAPCLTYAGDGVLVFVYPLHTVCRTKSSEYSATDTECETSAFLKPSTSPEIEGDQRQTTSADCHTRKEQLLRAREHICANNHGRSQAPRRSRKLGARARQRGNLISR